MGRDHQAAAAMCVALPPHRRDAEPGQTVTTVSANPDPPVG